MAVCRLRPLQAGSTVAKWGGVAVPPRQDDRRASRRGGPRGWWSAPTAVQGRAV